MSLSQPDPATQLATLRSLRDTVTDPVQLGALDALIAQLEAAETLRSHTQTIGDNAHADVAIAGDTHGDVKVGDTFAALVQIFIEAANIDKPSQAHRELLHHYLDNLVDRCNRLSFSGIIDWQQERHTQPTYHLTDVYTPQNMVNVVKADPVENSDSLSVGRPLPAIEILNSGRRLLILLGDLGSGKTSFLRFLAVTLAQSGQSAGKQATLLSDSNDEIKPLFPIYASLGDIAQWLKQRRAPLRTLNGQTLWDYVLSKGTSYAFRGLEKHIKIVFLTGKLILLLDGLDEVSDSALRVDIAGALAQIAVNTKGYIVVTCRSKSFTKDIAEKLADWSAAFTLAPFSPQQIHEFIQKWHSAAVANGDCREPDAERDYDVLARHLKQPQNHGDTSLAQQPLLLTLMALLTLCRHDLSKDRNIFYENITALLLDRWVRYRSSEGAVLSLDQRLQGISHGTSLLGDIRNLLEQLAFEAHRAAPVYDITGLLQNKDVRYSFISLFEKNDSTSAIRNADETLDYLEAEAQLFERDPRHARFSQWGLELYLSACYLARQHSDEFLQQAYAAWSADPDRWHEVIFLALKNLLGTERGSNTVGRWLQYLLSAAPGNRSRSQEEQQRAGEFAVECFDYIGKEKALERATTIDIRALLEALERARLQRGGAGALIGGRGPHYFYRA